MVITAEGSQIKHLRLVRSLTGRCPLLPLPCLTKDLGKQPSLSTPRSRLVPIVDGSAQSAQTAPPIASAPPTTDSTIPPVFSALPLSIECDPIGRSLCRRPALGCQSPKLRRAGRRPQGRALHRPPKGRSRRGAPCVLCSVAAGLAGRWGPFLGTGWLGPLAWGLAGSSPPVWRAAARAVLAGLARRSNARAKTPTRRRAAFFFSCISSLGLVVSFSEVTGTAVWRRRCQSCSSGT
jgi:hypothetical protein